MSEYELYSYWRSSLSYRVRIALNFKGLEFETHPVHLMENGGMQNAPEYKSINPMASVPALKIGDRIFTQSCAILEYLEEKYAVPALLPTDIDRRAFIRQIMNVVSCDIHPMQNIRTLLALTGEFGLTQNQKNEWCKKWFDMGLESLETMVIQSGYYHDTSPYLTGEDITYAEVCLVPMLYSARRLDIDLSPYPVLRKVEHNCLLDEAFINAAPDKQPDAPEDQRPGFAKDY